MSYPKFKDWQDSEKFRLIANFKILEKEFKSIGYDILLHAGTLLGALRDGELIPEDNDIDFIILHNSSDRKQIEKEIIEINNYFYNRKRLCRDYHFIGNEHYYVDDMHFDGWNGWIENGKLYTAFDIYGDIDEKDVLPIKQITLHGETFNTVSNPEKICQHMYGKTWKTPSANKHPRPEKSLFRFFNGHRYIPEDKIMSQREILLDLKALLDSNNIPFWLMTGTLLGAVREKNFIAHDPKDIDIGLFIEDYWKVKALIDSSDFKYKFQWNKEFAVYKGKEVHPHIDLFFHSQDKDNFYCYSYKPNRITNRWNEEWRMYIPKHVLQPFKDIEFLGQYFNAPGETEDYLTLLYGLTWRVPDPDWKYTGFHNVDNKYSCVTAIATTWNRPESLQKLVESFCTLYPEIPLIIGSQNKEPISFNFPNVSVLQLEEDCGLSVARNELVKNVKTEFTLLLEDDFIVTKNTNIFNMLEVFSYDENIGIVGGRLWQDDKVRSYEKFLFVLDKVLLTIDWNKLVSEKVISVHKINQTEFGICDICFNFFLAKTEVLRKYAWDSKHKIHSEHLDFFLNIKTNSNIKIAFIPNILIQHEHPLESGVYADSRQRMFYNHIYEKYGIEKGYTLGESCLFNYKENKRENIK